MTLSVIVHTFNEEKNLPACLESVRFADEVVVIDNDSTDRTVAIAKAAKARVEYFHGQHGYPEPARVFGLSQLRSEWVLILDADERVSPELRDTLLRLKNDPHALAGYWVPIRNFHFGQWCKHGGLYPDLHMRFFKRTLGSYPEVGLHRGVHVAGEVGKLQADILHYSYRDIQHYFEKFNTYTTVEAKRIVEQGRRPSGYDVVLKPWHRFFKAYVQRAGFLDGFPGFLFHVFSAAYVFCSELKAWDTFRSFGEVLPVLATLFKRKK